MIFDNAGRRMCPCECGMTFDEAVKSLEEMHGDSVQDAVKFLESLEGGA